MAEAVIAGLSPRRPWFDAGPVHVRFVVASVALGVFFFLIIYFGYPPSVAFQQYYILIFMLLLLLPQGKADEAWEHSTKAMLFRIWRALDRKVLSLCLYLNGRLRKILGCVFKSQLVICRIHN